MDVDAFLAAMRGFQPEAASMDLGDLLGPMGPFGLPPGMLDQAIARARAAGVDYRRPSFGAPDVFGQADGFGLPPGMLDQAIARAREAGVDYQRPSFGAPDVFGQADGFGLPQPLIDRAVSRAQQIPVEGPPIMPSQSPVPVEGPPIMPVERPPVPVQRSRAPVPLDRPSRKAAPAGRAPVPVSRRSAKQAPPDGMSPAERYAWQNDEARRRAEANATKPPHQQSVGPGLADFFNLFAPRSA